MNTLYENRQNIRTIRDTLALEPCPYYAHQQLLKQSIDASTISIVMTSSNRSKQTYFTLDSIRRSQFKNVHIVLVDDSTDDPVRSEQLDTYPFTIDFIQINRSKKIWANPCVNYNIGFRFVKGDSVIIQNAEVCHVGDVLAYLNERSLKDNTYYVMDVAASKDFTTNQQIYDTDLSTTDIFHKSHLYHMWYQSATRNNKYHFLTALTRKTLEAFGGFSYDYTYGEGYDDDDMLLRVAAANISIVCCHFPEAPCGGIHLFHNSSNFHQPSNQPLFLAKQRYLNAYKTYVEVSQAGEGFEEAYAKLARI
jgi:hypothetical protein